jgi:hypothetical protein
LNHSQFIEALEKYYYKYDTQFVKQAIFKYVKRIDQAELENVFVAIQHSYSRKWGKTPDIAIIDEAIKGINKIRYHKPGGMDTIIKLNGPAKLNQDIKQIED